MLRGRFVSNRLQGRVYIQPIGSPSAAIEDAAIEGGCSYGQRVIDGVTAWAIWGPVACMEALLSELNDARLFARTGCFYPDEARERRLVISNYTGGRLRCTLAEFLNAHAERPDVCSKVDALGIRDSVSIEGIGHVERFS